MRKFSVQLLRKGVPTDGRLRVYEHHVVFDQGNKTPEVWLAMSIIQQVERRPHSVGGFSALRVRCRDFTFFTFNFEREIECTELFTTLRSLACIPSIENVYAFTFRSKTAGHAGDSWKLYSPEKEFERQGLGTTFRQWRLTYLNRDYTFSPTYPAVLAVPLVISDNVLKHAGKYRSKCRVPVLTYIHALNGCTISRASQPMVGLKQNRSLQDEALVSNFFKSTAQQPNVYGATASGHLIVDARPTANAMANVALGAGSENMDNYPTAKKVYLGIENIHVMRDSLSKVIEAIKDSDLTPLPPNKDALQRSNWLKHISNVIEGAILVSRTIHLGGSHVLVHCSDGWDRTSQLCSLAELLLDPYYRTLSGFFVLIEKDWLSFGHRFADRCGHLISEKAFINSATSDVPPFDDKDPPNSPTHEQAQSSRAQNALHNLSRKFGEVKFNVGGGTQTHHVRETSPIFHQFLDSVFQILTQFPNSFEFNERLLRRLLYHTYSCQYGTFLYNSENERTQANVKDRTRAVWDYFLTRPKLFKNPEYKAIDKGGDCWIRPDTSKVRFWASLFGRSDEEMNGRGIRTEAGAGAGGTVVAEEVGAELAKRESEVV